jgi:eukaryotic-like serine/threonine-protein kinase
LLAGRLPFDASQLSPAALVEAVTEKDPLRPSAACVDAQLGTMLRGDLDSIVLKALARNPKERYQSVPQFAEDLNRYLEGRPVGAAQGSRWYIARKFVRRNALAVSAAAILLLTLSAGLAGTLWQAHIARQERLNAEQRFNDARQLANYLLFDLYDSVGKISGTMPVQRDMAQRTLQYLDRMAAIRTNDPSLGLEVAQGYLRLGTILGRKLGSGDSLGDTNQALASDRKALAIIEPLAAEHPSDLATRRTLASIQRQLGVALVIELKYDDAFPWLQKSCQIFDEIARSHPTDLQSLLDAGQSWQTLGKTMSDKGGYVAFNAVVPLEHLNRAVQYLRAALRLSPTNTTALMTLAATYEAIGRIDSLPNPSKGTQDYQIGLDALANLTESERQTAEAQQVRARLLVLLGWNQGQLGELKESLATLEAARPLLDAQATADPQNTGPEYRRFELYRSLGLVYGYAKDTANSLADLRTALSIMDKIMQRDTANANYPVLRAEMQGRVATVLFETGRSAEAFPYAQASVTYFKKLGENPAVTSGELMEAIRSTANNAVPSLRDYQAALRFALHADQLSNGKDPAILGYLAESYALNKKYPEAADAAKRGLAQVPAPKPGQPASQLRQWLQSEFNEYQSKAR